MAADPTEDAWLEECYITIAKQDGSDREFAALTETIDIDAGEKDIEGIPLVNGGRVVKWSPEGDTTITFEAYPLQVGTEIGATGVGYYDLLHSSDTSGPIRILNDRNRDKHRILIMWTNDSTVTSAKNTTAANASAIRLGFAEAYFTSVKPSFTDGILKFTITAKVTAFDKSGAANILAESCAGTTGTDKLPAIALYTSANKFG